MCTHILLAHHGVAMEAVYYGDGQSSHIKTMLTAYLLIGECWKYLPIDTQPVNEYIYALEVQLLENGDL